MLLPRTWNMPRATAPGQGILSACASCMTSPNRRTTYMVARIAYSATATEFAATTFATGMPSSRAASRSMVSSPTPTHCSSLMPRRRSRVSRFIGEWTASSTASAPAAIASSMSAGLATLRRSQCGGRGGTIASGSGPGGRQQMTFIGAGAVLRSMAPT